MPQWFEKLSSFGKSRDELLFFNNPRSIRVGEDKLVCILRVDEIQIERVAGLLNPFKEHLYFIVVIHKEPPKLEFWGLIIPYFGYFVKNRLRGYLKKMPFAYSYSGDCGFKI